MALQQTTKPTVTETRTVTIKPKTLQKLRVELKNYAALKARKDAIEAEMSAGKERIGELRESTGEDKLSIDGFSLALVQPVRKVLNQKKLVELGCAIAWIEQATENVPTAPYEKISFKAEKTEAE